MSSNKYKLMMGEWKMKKKILFAACAMLMATSAFATIVTKNITTTPNLAAANESVNWGWSISKPADVVYINNQTAKSLEVFVGVDTSFGAGDPQPYDPTVVVCGDGKQVTLSQNSSVVCNVPTGTQVKIQVKQESFQNGARGTYSVLN